MEQVSTAPVPDRLIASLRQNPLFDALSDEKLGQIAAIVREATVEQVTGLLRKIPLFAGLRDEDLRGIQEISTSKLVEKGETLFQEGEPGEAFYVVLRGAVELTKRTPAAAEERLAVRRSGEAFGEMALLTDKARSASARASERTHLLAVSRKAFYALLGGDTLAVRLLQGLAKALWAMDVRFAAKQREDKSAEVLVSEISRLIQRGLLPGTVPQVAGYEIAAGTSVLENGRGSAVWQWFQLGDGRPVLAALDAKGEGLPAAHHLSIAQVLLREVGRQENDLAQLLRRVNRALTANSRQGFTRCVQCGVLALGDGQIEWASAGRPAAVLRRRNGELEELPGTNAPLGAAEDAAYAVHRLVLEPGEVALVLSDVPEAVVREARSAVAAGGQEDASRMASRIRDAVENVVRRLSDGQDAATIVVRRLPQSTSEAGVTMAADATPVVPVGELPELLQLS
ncbi:MAG: cyclic nucleotide-binding domain-containing protein [Gemmatimonadetes bacterium]|nr:cyclic nucleotide-binding domain-containing protein [Gemmatimonadota bacterium]